MDRICFSGNHYPNSAFVVLYSPCFKFFRFKFLRYSFFMRDFRVFPRPFRHGGTSAGGQSVNGGTHEGDIDLMGPGT